MHHFMYRDPETHFEIYVNYNSDMSGDAIVTIPNELVNIDWTDGGQTANIKLPAKMLAEFARNATIHEIIGTVEDLLT